MVDGVNEAWVADRPTSHRCWPSRSAFQGWLCLDNTSQYRCWRWKPTELSEEEIFRAFVHCGALELDPEREDRRSWSWRAYTEATVKCFLTAKFSRIYSTHGSWCVYLLNCCWRRWVGDVAGMTWESWDGNWLKLEVLLTSLSWWWTLCRESLALIFFVECGPVLQVYTSAWGSYQQALVTLRIMENALKSSACRHGTDSRCCLGY